MAYRGNDGLQGGPPEGRGDHLALAVMKVVFRCDKASAQEVLHAILEEAALWQGHSEQLVRRWLHIDAPHDFTHYRPCATCVKGYAAAIVLAQGHPCASEQQVQRP